MHIREGFEYRLRPNAKQVAILRRYTGCCRFVWNKALVEQKKREALGEEYIGLAGMYQWLDDWRNSQKSSFLREAPIHALKSTLKDLDDAFRHYFQRREGYPKFKRRGEQLEYIDSFDLLTGLPNRALFYDRIAQAFAHSKHQNTMMAVCFMDLDGFKETNENYGHEIGDELLVSVSDRLRNTLNEWDTISRVGGDEFVLLLTDIVEIQDVERALNHILMEIRRPFEIDGKEIAITTSIGVTVFPKDGADPETLVRHADQAMYMAKQEGKNRFHCFDPAQDQEIYDGHQLAAKIIKALRGGEMVLYYQPKVNMRTGAVVGMEALLRWKHPTNGLLGPTDFLHLFDHKYLYAEISEWAIRSAMSQQIQWNSANFHTPISVNVEASYLMKQGFPEMLASILSEYPSVDAQSLELEILESVAIKDLQRVGQTIKACRDLGVSFALDDFGTGYSSLTYLKHLPVNTLKIDQTFVRDMLHNQGDLAVARGVISMADVFKLEVIAEGVETPEHGTMLMHLGCDVAQGYGISRPMPAEDVVDWVRSYQPYPLWQSSIHTQHKESTPQKQCVV